MSPDTLRWLLALHVFAIVIWTGSLLGLSFVLKQHANAVKEAWDELALLERGLTTVMDIAASLAIGSGLAMLIAIPSSLLQVSMYPKLALVLGAGYLHHLQRARVAHGTGGSVSAEPSWMVPVAEFVIAGLVVFAVAKPL